MIFDFWSGLPGDSKLHPKDAEVLNTIAHSYDLSCLPGPYRGPLKTAKVVLLFSNPGLSDDDIVHAADPDAQAYYVRMRSGEHPLPTDLEHHTAYIWLIRVLGQFGAGYEAVRSKIATLNLSAYKSLTLDHRTLIATPSCRVTVDWAQSVLFPSAINRERVVVCMRSHSSWGLAPDDIPKGFLYAPSCTRSGMIRAQSPLRQAIIEAVREALDLEKGTN